MQKLAWSVVITLAAGLSLTTPAAAQHWNNAYNYGRPVDPNNPNFNPAAAAINALNTSFPRRRGYSAPIDCSLIDAMKRGDTRALPRLGRGGLLIIAGGLASLSICARNLRAGD